MNEKLNDALNEISDKHIAEAVKSRQFRKIYWLGAVAAVLVAAILVGTLYPLPSSPSVPGFFVPIGTENSYQLSNLVAAPSYPQINPYPQLSNFQTDEAYMAAYEAWEKTQKEQYDQPEGYADSLTDFFRRSICNFLSGEENRAYSPVNLYLALAMLTESAEGSSRQQLLDLLGVGSIDALQQQAGHIWNAHYANDGRSTLLLANSLWLDDAYGFRKDTVDTLAGSYYASVFHGDLGSDSMNQQLCSWLNANTGDLLTEQANNTKLPPDTVAALASTVYFSAQWDTKFFEGATANQVFHTPQGDVDADFMNQTYLNYPYYWDEDFGAICLGLSGDNNMWLILPDEEKTPQDLLSSGAFLTMAQAPDKWEQTDLYEIQLCLPKFDISSQTDLVENMKALGVTDVFQAGTADLSGLIGSGADNPYIDKIDHAVRVAIDEEGCTAAAYTVIQAPSGGMPQEREKIDLTLNRPFLFLVTSRDNLPLFAGVVTNP